ncbi:MAG TPA: hypothetical protein VI815_02950 [Candidatus Nanoarchaeia archaeon]|nr:hypothetical protein [Candidatus Nanoarchaeia archaeon]
MGLTVSKFYDNAGLPITDSITVKLYGPLDNTPTDHIGSTYGVNTGMRTFSDLPAGDYNLFFDNIIESGLSPLFIAGPVIPTFSPAAGDISSTMLADNAVTTDKLAANAVGTAKIADAAVTSAKLADGAIEASKIGDQSVAKSKLGTDVFNGTMLDDGGFGPKVDSTSIGFNVLGELEVIDNSITSDKLAEALATANIADAAVTEAKIADGAVTTNKLGDASTTESKIADAAVTTNKIANEAVTFEKISSLAIAQLRDANYGIPSDVAYVSANYANLEAPYFTLIQDAIDYLETAAIDGAILIQPGTYTESIIINSSISLVGIDKARCIINHIPTAAINQAVKITGQNTLPITLQNLTIKCLSDNAIDVDAIGIYSNHAVNKLLISNADIIVQGRNHATNPTNGIGVFIDTSLLVGNVEIEKSKLVVTGGNHTASGTGKDAFGIKIPVRMNLAVNFTSINVIEGTGLTNGAGYPIYVFGNDITWVYPKPPISIGGVIAESNSPVVKNVSNNTGVSAVIMASAYSFAPLVAEVSTAIISSEANEQVVAMEGILQ